jgi:hypothetical protein
MTNQPRDKNGRFVGKKEKMNSWHGVMLIITICILVGLTSYGSYHNGYREGFTDKQPAIYQTGFDAGMTQQKNIDELGKNWTHCGFVRNNNWSFDNIYYKNDNPNWIRIVNGDYSTRLEWGRS